MTMAVEEACSGWCCVWNSKFWGGEAVEADSLRQVTDLSFHRMHFSFSVTEGGYNVLNLLHVKVRSIFLM